VLEAENLRVTVNSVEALRGVSVVLHPGETVGLLGRNGAGKTTTLRALMGLLPIVGGAIRYNGREIQALPAHRRAALGIGYMPEDRRLVPQLTVEENVLVPAWAIPHLDRQKRLEVAYDLLPEVADMRTRRALLLSGGQQKLVALARAVVAGTRVLLLDEPFEGVAPALSWRLAEVIAALKGDALAVLIAQSDANYSAQMLDRRCLIERGANVNAVAKTCAP